MDPHIAHSDIASYAASNVNLDAEHARKYRAQVNALRDRLAAKIKDDPEFALVKMLHSGSVAKGTALSTISDMDVAVYVRKASAPADPADLLDWLAERLREANPQLNHDQFYLGTHCVSINFRASGLTVDVVPVLDANDKDDRGYLLNRDTGEWLETSIPLHLEFIRRRKTFRPVHFAQTIRLIKWWAAQQKTTRAGFRFKSFLIELLCAYLLDNGADLSNYPIALEEFFAYIVKSGLQETIVFTDYTRATPSNSAGPIRVFDPVNLDNNVAANYSDEDRRLMVDAAYDALDALTEAHHSDTKGRSTLRWKEVLGPSFRA